MTLSAMDYFAQLLAGDSAADALRLSGRPVVGTMCNFVPDELVIAAGAIPVRLDAGDHHSATAAEAVLPRDACPVVRSAAGLVQRRDGVYGLLKLLVVPTPCDAKRKLAPALEETVPVHVLPLPSSKDGPGSAEAWRAELRRLIVRLEGLTGEKLTQRSLRAAIDHTNARQQAFRRLHELRRLQPPAISGSEVVTVAAASFVAECEAFTRALEALFAERSQRAVAQPQSAGPRVLITGAPTIPPNTRLLDVIEAAGLHIVADDLCSATERLYHPALPMEWTFPEMLRAVAEKALLPSTCPCFTDYRDRTNRLRGLAEEFRADGIIYHNLRTCMLFQFETAAVRGLARDLDLPMLELSTDYTVEDVEQLRTRVQAFAEMLVARQMAER